LPYISEKIWALVKQSIGGFLGVTGFLLSLVMVPIYLFFLLKESPAIERRWREYLPLRASPLKDEVAAVLSQINNYVIAYFRGQLLVCLIDGTLIGIALYLTGLNFAPLIGILVVILTMIPYVGIILCWIPAVLIAAGQWGDWTHPLIVTGVFVICAMAYLTYLGAAAGSPNQIDMVVDKKYEAGKLVAAQSGCLACHKIGENGNDGPGPHLTDIGAKLYPAAIECTLDNPTAPMPSFRNLPPDKKKALVAFLSQLKGE
jgi:MFS family permease